MIEKIKEYYKRRKLLNRYNKKKINPKYYGVVDVSGLSTVQPMKVPSGNIFHLDYVYEDYALQSKNFRVNDIRKNIDKLIEIIEE